MKRTIEVVPYDSAWPERFREEAEDLLELFGSQVVAIHHVGSTAIPGIRAKPIIDVLVVVRDLEEIDQRNEEMVARGYIPKGSFGIPGRRFFIKGTETERTHHVHVFGRGHPAIRRHLTFRDYLRAHPERARAYSDLKAELARRFRHDIEGYMAGKDAFIKAIEKEGRAWQDRREATDKI
jgi:GrpB-like predicted nucleotidyltransferase (UPF0157 family)